MKKCPKFALDGFLISIYMKKMKDMLGHVVFRDFTTVTEQEIFKYQG